MNDTIQFTYIENVRDEITLTLNGACIINVNTLPDGDEYFDVRIFGEDGSLLYRKDYNKLTAMYKALSSILVGIRIGKGLEV